MTGDRSLSTRLRVYHIEWEHAVGWIQWGLGIRLGHVNEWEGRQINAHRSRTHRHGIPLVVG